MLHDYNNIVYKGAKQAAQDFCDKNDISFIPIPDIAGTIVITK